MIPAGAIDCDLHPALPDTRALLPHLEPYWREHVLRRGMERDNLEASAFPPTAPILVQATLTAGEVILSAAGLSFLGLGVQPPAAEWGAMMSEGRNYLGIATHLSLFPGLAITFTVLGLNLLGDGMRDRLDPRFRGRL